jgi:hypothetical protein
MVHDLLRRFATNPQSTRPWARPRRNRRPWLLAELEGLEGRLLLAATVYTVTNTSPLADISGSLPNAVSQADGNSNPDGSVIQFSQATFRKPQTIALKGTLVLSQPDGPAAWPSILRLRGLLAGSSSATRSSRSTPPAAPPP